MEYNRGIFGVLNQDDMEGQPLVLLDGGVESRLQGAAGAGFFGTVSRKEQILSGKWPG